MAVHNKYSGRLVGVHVNNLVQSPDSDWEALLIGSVDSNKPACLILPSRPNPSLRLIAFWQIGQQEYLHEKNIRFVSP